MSDPEIPRSQASRSERLIGALERLDLDLFLTTDPTNVRWLTGFTGSNGACLIGGNQRLFLTDFRYAERARELDGWDAEIISGDWFNSLAKHLTGRVGLEDDRLTLRQYRQLVEHSASDGTELVSAGGTIESLRRTKDSAEIEAITAAAELTDSIYLELIERGLVGRKERDVARFAVARMRDEGAEPSFDPIVAAGPNGASPHAEPSEREIGPGELVTIDMGSLLDGYCSDATRTFATGSPTDLDGPSREIYEVTLEAQLKGLDAVMAGAVGADVDRVARDVIVAAGYGDSFGHGLGHGVGLEIHEAPRLGPRSEDVLKQGDVVTVEPGIYLAGKTGVRIEDMVSVGETGIAHNFTGLSKELTFIA